MAMPQAGTPIIIDIGSAYVKVGFAGEDKPRSVFPCITGTEKYKSVMADVSTRSIYVGEDAMKMRGVLKISHPIQRGVIQDWNVYYELLNHIFYNVLRLENLVFHPIVYVEAPFAQSETRQYIARVLFETHKASSLLMIPSPLMSLYSTRLKTGLVIESGDGTTWIVPIINGQIYNPAVQRLYLGGHDVNQNLMALLMRQGIMVSSSAAEEILREIKEKNCYFVLDTRNPPPATEAFQYPMPDGTYISMPSELLYQAPEVMFDPTMLGYNSMNIPQAIIYSLQLINQEHWGDLLTNIVLSGGNASYSGFEERLKQELVYLLPQLGQIPKPQAQFKPKLKLETIEITQKSEDNCPQCGELVDLTINRDICPACGALMKITEISFDLGSLGKKEPKKKKKLKGKCPHCLKQLSEDASLFCPFCGKTIEAFEAPEMFDEFIEQIEEQTTQEFSGFFDPTDEFLRIRTPKSLKFAIFNGAARLGNLPEAKNYFINHSQFTTNPNLLNIDITDLLLK